MKRKFFTTLAIFASLAITACGGAQQGKWESNNTNHWHVGKDGEKIDSEKHTFKEDEAQAVAATCENDGKKVEICTVCGFVKESVVTKLGHKWDDGEITKPASCSEPGEKSFKCTRTGCNGTKVEQVLAAHDLQPIAHDLGEGEVTEVISKCSKDAYYQIEFNPYDANAVVSTSSDKHSSYVKLSKQVAADGTGTASTIEWKIWSPVALKGRFWIDITGNTSNLWDRESKSGAQALFYTYDDSTTKINTWKNKVELNDVEVDFENATYKVGEEDIKFGELVYSDFGELSDSTSGTPISVPMPEVNLKEGVNTLKFTRLTGYAFNMHKFTFKTSL